MDAEHERWAEALAVDQLHGPRAPVVIAERIASLAQAGDAGGVQRWREIASCYDELTGGTRQ